MTFPAARNLMGALALGAVVAPGAGAPTDGKPPVMMDSIVVSETKTHTLFMGADITVDYKNDLRPVKDVFGGSWVIMVDGQERHIATRESSVGIKFTPSLKLTDTSATITGYSKVPAYSWSNDPSVMITKGLSRAAVVSTFLQGVADDGQHTADTASNKDLGGAAVAAGADHQFGDIANMQTARFIYAETHSNPNAKPGQLPGQDPFVPSEYFGMTGPQLNQVLANQNARIPQRQTENRGEPAGRLATLGRDAMDITFTVSSNKPLHNPYVVTMARFHPAGAKPGVVQNLVYAKALDPIDIHPTAVQFEEDGYPAEYELLDFQLHLYDRGREVATTVSEDRVEMTRDEAFEYVKMEYMSVHRSDTLPPVAAMGNLPSDLPTKLAIGKYPETFYVRVTKKGLPGEFFADESCARKIEDPYLASVVNGLRFKPALSHGKPVEGVAAVNLGKLQI
jgi:hypothetical protein